MKLSIIIPAHNEQDRIGKTVDTYHDFGYTFTEQEIDEFLAPYQSDFVKTADEFVRGMFPDSADSMLVDLVAGDMSSAPTDVALSAFGN